MNPLITRDLKHIWHPCSQMKDFETCPPLLVTGAKGSYLYTDRGPLIDAISSWWCKSLGHGHPAVIAALEDQLTQFEHVIGANTTYEALVELGEALSDITQKQHVFFASDGATAVEIALKLTLHAQSLKGMPQKNQFIALKNAYHGESFGTMAVSDLGLFKAAYGNFGPPCHWIRDIPYVLTDKDPVWEDCSAYWDIVEPQLDRLAEQVAAVILEPLVQGAGGMLFYSPDFLKKIRAWSLQKGIYLIADEIMTGMGRTGKWLASHHAPINPDLICLSKGLTSGAAPLSCVLIDKAIFDLFYGDYHEGNAFLHSNTYSGHPLAVRAALATITSIREEGILEQSKALEASLLHHLEEVASLSGHLRDVRALGGIAAAELIAPKQSRIGQAVYRAALKHGALLRPIGNTLYWLPPLNTDKETIGKLAEITLHSIYEAYDNEWRTR